jgi:hypothetical protein
MVGREVEQLQGEPVLLGLGQLLEQIEQIAGCGPGPALLFLGGLDVAAGWPPGGGLSPGARCARSCRLRALQGRGALSGAL